MLGCLQRVNWKIHMLVCNFEREYQLILFKKKFIERFSLKVTHFPGDMARIISSLRATITSVNRMACMDRSTQSWRKLTHSSAACSLRLLMYSRTNTSISVATKSRLIAGSFALFFLLFVNIIHLCSGFGWQSFSSGDTTAKICFIRL